jgi:hypothetical protein
MAYNVRFVGHYSPTWWSTPQKLEKEETASATGAGALMKLSMRDYHSVCLEFSPKIRTIDGDEVGEVCNRITQYGGGPTDYSKLAGEPRPPREEEGEPGANV